MNKEKYFYLHEKFTDWIEKDGQLYSTLVVEQPNFYAINPIDLNQKKFPIVMSHGKVTIESRELISDIIYQHPSRFYIYLSKMNVAEITFKVIIYYKQQQHDEVLLYLKKIKKNEIIT